MWRYIGPSEHALSKLFACPSCNHELEVTLGFLDAGRGASDCPSCGASSRLPLTKVEKELAYGTREKK